MRLYISLALAVLIAAPAVAQEQAPPEQQATPGLVIVGHGPDVPNAGPESEAVQPDAAVAPMVVFVPVPVFVQVPHARHHRKDADPAASVPRSPAAQVVSDPSTRVTSDPSNRVKVDPSSRITTDPSARVKTDPSNPR